MTVTPSAPAATRPEEPRFLVLRAGTRTRGPSLAHPLLESIRVRVVPDPTLTTPQRWPSFEGLALLDRRSGALTHLFVLDPSTHAVLEWRLAAGVLMLAPTAPAEGSGA
jgi:hypothetical protein